jgi:hypothetical protein
VRPLYFRSTLDKWAWVRNIVLVGNGKWSLGRKTLFRVGVQVNRYAIVLAWVLIAIWLAPSAGLALDVCDGCGHEVTGRACGHCGAARVATAPDPASTAARAPTDSRPASPWDKVIEEDIALARDLYRGGRPEVAYHFCRNALAINFLVEDEVARKARAVELVKMRDACAASGRFVNRTCPVCEGSGRGVFQPKSITSNAALLIRPAGTCKRCGGSGRIKGRETVDETKFRRAQTLTAYREIRLGRTDVMVGSCWLPKGKDKGLNLTQRVALKRAIPLKCENCYGVGREDCSSCRGHGIEACRASGCEGGEVEEKRAGLSKEDPTIRRPCGICRGTGEEACERCSGSGSKLCGDCGGGGEAKLCKRCEGRGLSNCRKCGGSGVYRDGDCSYCEGGVAECSSCNGSGRRR